MCRPFRNECSVTKGGTLTMIGRPRFYATNAARQRAYRLRKKHAAQQQLQIWHRHPKDTWETPSRVFDPVQRAFGISLAVCATADNATCPRDFSPTDDGLLQDWGQAICWMKPPFSQGAVWLRKARDSAQAGATVVCLVKHTPGGGWWRKTILPDTEVRALGRVKFVGAKHPSPFDVALVILRPPPTSP
jgi:phage N-6-adenine-methyltransferase